MAQLKADWYMRVILTVIAVALCWLVIRPLVIPEEATALARGKEPIPVEITNWAVGALWLK